MSLCNPYKASATIEARNFKSKGKGYGKLLLNECVKDAKKLGMKGAVMIASEKSWLVNKAFLEKHSFELVDQIRK